MVRDLWFEDFIPGQRFETAGCTLSEAQILAFAWDHDPQPFHIDKIAAEASPYGGIIASGFQTLLISFRLIYQERIINAASLGSPGLDELRWLRPVRPGDTLKVAGEVLESRASASRPDRGTVRIAYTVLNQAHEPVMTYQALHILRRRP
ncbi:MaoC family dehydratase [Benzoatithermus flavus]|uniref:MaoC family dehydratase n=1 Tax=Benzoatithermus flavus TaxID=3108223 RepID=A0ABU8XV59_9PROT